MLFLWFVDTAVKVNMYGESVGGGPTNLWRAAAAQGLAGIRLHKRFSLSGSEQRRDVVLQSVDVRPAGQDRRLLDRSLQDAGEIKETG